jgi:hypothetical protein
MRLAGHSAVDQQAEQDKRNDHRNGQDGHLFTFECI